MQPANKTIQQYANDLIDKSCKVAEVYDKGALNYISIKVVDASIHQMLRLFWAKILNRIQLTLCFKQFFLFVGNITGNTLNN